jgi:aryl-alcohol dehydrogenase
MRITAAVTRAPHSPQSIETLDLAGPRDLEILVRVVATGVCHTDIGMRDQVFPVPQPIVLGHEGAGVVEQIGSAVSKIAIGDHVVMTYNSCGVCESCLENQATYCHDFFGRNFAGGRSDSSSPLSKKKEHIHGNFFGQSSFANYAICHERNAVKIPKDVPLELMGPLACGIQTGAGAVINSLKLRPGKSIAVFGTGSVGLSAIMAAKIVGATTIIAVDVKTERLNLAKELGATHTIKGDQENAVKSIVGITGTGVHFSFDTTANAKVIRQAVDSLTLRGECGLVGASAPGTEFSLDMMHLMTAGRKVRGIVEGDSVPQLFIPELIQMHRQGKFPFDRLIKFYDLRNINQAIADSESGKTVKAVVRMSKDRLQRRPRGRHQ